MMERRDAMFERCADRYAPQLARRVSSDTVEAAVTAAATAARAQQHSPRDIQKLAETARQLKSRPTPTVGNVAQLLCAAGVDPQYVLGRLPADLIAIWRLERERPHELDCTCGDCLLADAHHLDPHSLAAALAIAAPSRQLAEDVFDAFEMAVGEKQVVVTDAGRLSKRTMQFIDPDEAQRAWDERRGRRGA